MTKTEFIYKIPDILTHKTWGYAELEFIKFPNGDNRVGILYRHRDLKCSYATLKDSWQELYDDLAPYLAQEGHMDTSKDIANDRDYNKQILNLIIK